MKNDETYTQCKTPNAAAKQLKTSDDTDLVDAAALAFVGSFMKRFFKTSEEDASRRIFEALGTKGSAKICEILTGASLQEIMVEAGVIPE